MSDKSSSRARLGALMGVTMLAAACSSGPAASPSTVHSQGAHVAKALTGTVESVSAATVVVKSSSATTTIALEAATKYKKGHVSVTEAALATGERVRVRLVKNDPTPTALAIAILAPELTGTVSALGSGEFTLTTPAGANYAITVSSSTRYREGKTSANATTLHVGARVKVTGTPGPSGTTSASTVALLP